MPPIGIFGGTFDPVHVGHLRLAEEAREQLGLSQVIWVPAGNPPLRAAPRTPAAHRLAMVRQAVAGHAGFSVDASEAESAAPSYTVDTLRRLRAQLGAQQPLVLLLGADAFARLPQWHDWRALFALAHIGVASRPGEASFDAPNYSDGDTAPNHQLYAELRTRRADAAALARAPAGAIVPFAITPLDVSASGIRALLSAGRSPRYLVDAAVLDYIQQHHLYQGT